MLEEISIKDLGVIQSATLPFTRGLTVITGETGAGKTMVLSALSLLLGKRSDASIVRHGSSFTSVEGCWNVEGLTILPAIQDVGATLEDGNLYVNRTVQKDGKSRAVVGGKTTPASVLATIGEGLVNIHGQSDQIRLKNPVAQRDALDAYAGKALVEALATYKELYGNWKTLTATIKDVKTNLVARQREFEELTTAIAEIDKVQPVTGEDEDLKTEAATLSNIEQLEEAAARALAYISNEEGDAPDIVDAANSVVKILSSVTEYDPAIEEMYQLAETIQINVTELSSNLASYLSNIDTNALERLNEVQERRAALTGLVRKYGVTLQDVIEYWETSSQRVTELDPEGSNLEKLEEQLVETVESLTKQAATISEIRSKSSISLQDAVNKELEGLMMSGNKLHIIITKSETFLPHGVDEIAFMLKTSGASEARPLNKSASGGELSRIMLALEVVLADPSITPTFVFDEVDSGVGGATAIEIGKRLSLLSRDAQVIVVTHLPQVAAFADNHLRVLKTNSESFTSTDVNQLSEDERIEELSRMLSGLSDSDTGKAHALELSQMASEYKQQ